MDFTMDAKMESYYRKVIELQEKLRKSEEERLKLEMKFNEMVHVSRDEERSHYRKLRHQYRKFLDEDKKRQERNERLFRALENIESRIDMLTSKTERLKMLRSQYQLYLTRVSQRHFVPPVDQDKRNAPDITDQERIEYLEKCLKNLNSRSDLKTMEEAPDYKTDLKKLDNLSAKLKSTFDSNRANDIAGEIMSSIYNRHYCKSEIRPSTRYSSSGASREEKQGIKDDISNLKYRNQISNNTSLEATTPIDGRTSCSNIDLNNILQSDDSDVELGNQGIDTIHGNDFTRENKLGAWSVQHIPTKNIPKSLTGNSEQESPTVNIGNMTEKLQREIEPTISMPESGRLEVGSKREALEDNTPIASVGVRYNDPNEKSSQIIKMYNDEEKIVFERAPPLDHNVQISSGTDEPEAIVVEAPDSVKIEQRDISPNKVDTLRSETQPAEPITHLQSAEDTNETIKSEQQPLDENCDNISDQDQIITSFDGYLTQNGHDLPDQQPIASTSGDNYRNSDQYNNSNQSANQYDEKVQLNHPENMGEYVSNYDEHGQPVARCDQNGQPILQYDENGQPVVQYDEKGQPILHYDENGQTVIQYDKNGQPIVQLDRNGQPAVQYDENSQSIVQYDENGQPLVQCDENGQPIVQYDENGQPIVQYDENGQPIVQYDENGQPIIQYAEDGQPLYQYDEYGQPINYYQQNEQSVVQYDENGQPLLNQYDENGHIPMQYDENGQTIAQYDENGQPLIQYDENGQPFAQYDQHRQYDENGRTIQQYDENGQFVTQYDENGQPISQYDQGGQPIGQYDQDGQPIGQYDQDDQPMGHYDQDSQPMPYDENTVEYDGIGQPDYKSDGKEPSIIQPNDNQSEDIQQAKSDEDMKQKNLQEKEASFGEEVKHYQDSSESIANGVDITKGNAVKNSVDVLEVLDTDTESSKHNTSKITNDSDFDFSNA